MANDLLSHAFGDYIVQSSWMANEKTSRSLPAAAHAVSYAACFLPITRSVRALAVIGGTHFVIDRWRLAKYICYAKNQAAPKRDTYPWSHADGTGYHTVNMPPYIHDQTGCQATGTPPWLSTWLLIIIDNTAHVCINRWALSRWRR